MNNTKIAFVGTGYMAEAYAQVLTKKFKFRNTIVGAMNRSNPGIKNFIKKYDVKKQYFELSTMMKESKPDIVFVCVNELSTYKILKTLCKFQCVCLIEKPVGLNFYESQKILKLKKNENFYPFVGLNRRFYSSVLNAKNLLKKDNSKRIIKIFDQEDTIAVKKLGRPLKVVKNWMFANSIHMIDFVNIFARGKIKKIIKVDKINKKNLLKEGVISCKLLFSSGDIVYYFCFWNRPAPWSLEISTKNNFLQLKPIEEFSYLESKSRKWVKTPTSANDIRHKPGIYLQLVEVFSFFKERKTKLKSLDYSNKLMKLIRDIYFD